MATPTDSDQKKSGHPKKEKRFLGLQTDPLIFLLAVGFIVIFVAGTVAFGESARALYASVSSSLMGALSWLYIGGVSAIFLFLVLIFVSRYGALRLGDDDDSPEYSLPIWFGMLFAAGLGATLMFWGAAEPLHHAFNPPHGDADSMSQEAIKGAFEQTYYHFALHMWVVFVLPGLALGYFIYKRKLPERVSSVFAPLLGGQIYRWPGKIIDALAIIGTVFGIAVSVGLGVLQINAGLNIIWDVPLATGTQMIIILAITGIACVSVASGLDKGIKILSNINIGASVVLMIFVLISGPTLILLRHSVESFGVYASSLPELMFWVDSYNESEDFLSAWTAFYWAWTICWGPFVGMFIARISRGRTVREFIGGVLGLISAFVLIWFSIFGRAAIEVELDDPGVLTGPVVEDGDTPVALFSLLSEYPLYAIVGPFALAIIVIFFITSIDSAAMVMDMIATGEENVSPVIYRIGWAVGIGAVTAALLFITDTGIEAIQEVVLIVALPFFIMEFIMCWSLLKGMNADYAAQRRVQTRKWERTMTPEELEEHEQKPAPGYDENGNEIFEPEWVLNEEGKWVISGDVVVEGDFGVTGSFEKDFELPQEENYDRPGQP